MEAKAEVSTTTIGEIIIIEKINEEIIFTVEVTFQVEDNKFNRG